MIGLRLSIDGAERQAQRLARISSDLGRELRRATRESTQFLRDRVSEKVLIPRRLNAQDSASARRLTGRKPVRDTYEGDGKTGYVRVTGHWTPARTRAVQASYPLSQLQRKGLWIAGWSYIKGADGKFQGRRSMKYQDRTGLTFFRFSRHPELLQWADRPDKGRQHLRHAVRMINYLAQRLLLGPAVERYRPDIVRRMQAATQRSLS